MGLFGRYADPGAPRFCESRLSGAFWPPRRLAPQQWIVQNVWSYPAIGALFLLNVIGSGVVGLALLVPLDRLLRAGSPIRH